MRKRIYMTRTIVMVMLFFLLLIPMFFYLGINCFVRLIREEAHREALLTAGAAAARIDRHLQAAHDRLRRLDAELSSRGTEPRSRARVLQQFAAAADSPFSGGLALYSPAGELLATDGDWHHTPSRLSSLTRETAISASSRTTLLQDPGGTPAIILLAPIGRSHGRTGAVAVSCVHLGGPRGLASRGLLPDTNRLSVSSGPITIWLPDAPIVPKTPAATETTAAGLTVSAYTDEDFLARARTATGECWLILLGGGLFTALLTTVVVMRRLVNPLISLSSQVRAITTDDAREERVTIDPRSDVAGIADAFNRHMEMLAHKEQQLADKNRLLASILDTASVGICAFDPEGRHMLVNKAYCQLSGYTEDELLGQPLTLVLPVEVHDEALSLHREHCAGTIDVIPPVWEGVCKDGSRKIVSIQRNRLTLENGDILAIVVIRDITDLQRSLDALRESEQRYRDLAEFLPQTVFETDLNGRITFVNQAAFIIFGHGMEALEQGLTVFDILAPEDHERARANMGRSLRGENTPVAGNEYTAHRQDGSTFPVLIHSAPLLRHGLVVGLRGILVDITDVKRAEMQLRIKERAIDASINGIAFAGPDGRITSANQSFLRLWGYGSEAEVIGREVASFWTQPHQAAAAAATVIEKGSWAGILVARRADGSTFDAQVSTSAVYDDDGRPVSLMASFIDVTEKLRVENALRQSEEKFRAIVETTQELVWTMGLDGRHTYINPALRDILGLAPDDFIGRPLDALLHPDDVALARETLEEAVSGVSGWTGIVLRWRHRDGSWRYLESNAAPMFSPDGVLAGFLGADRDITARILAEEELQETQRRFTDILTNVKLASVILNADGIVTFCNDFLLELGGWQRHELLGANWFDLFIPASDRDRMKAFFCSSISLGEIAPHFENPIVTRSGETCLIRWNNTLLYDRQGRPSGTASIGENITRKREAEEALRKSEERYRTLFQGAYEAIIVLRDGCIVECNQRALELFRCSREEILGHPPTDFSPPLQADGLDSEESARQKIAAALAGTPQHYEWRLRHADGTETDVEATLCRLEYEGGVELLAIGRDVTLRKKTEQALLLAKKTADTASRAKSEFLANMSHEIRTPLTAIIGFTDLLQETEDRGLQKKYLDMIHTSGDILMNMVRDVLDLAKIEAGKLELEICPFSLSEVIERSIAAHAAIARQKEVEFSTWIDPAIPPTLLGDPEHLRQILANLVSNAVKFTHKGEIVLSVVQERQKGKSATASSRRVLLHFSVRDTGIGIAEERQAAIFDSFTQADGSTTRKYGGTGLGTTIAKGLVELMGGTIWFESSPGIGSTFHTMLPFSCTDAEGSAATSRMPSSILAEGMLENRRGPLAILLVEDNLFTQSFIRTSLERYGHEVTLAENGRQAVDSWQEKSFDLVLMDVQLPQMNGLDATREIRLLEQESGRHTPIIAMTANAFKEDRLACLEAGMDDFLTKPINVAVFLKHLLGYAPEASAPCAKENDIADAGRDRDAFTALFRLEELPAALRTDRDRLREFAFLLLHDLERSIDATAVALRRNDLREMRRAAHNLKGAAAHLRETRIGQLAAELEQITAEDAAVPAEAMVDELQAAYRSLAATITV